MLSVNRDREFEMSLFGYVSPQTLDEALSVLAANPRAVPLAGGNNVLLPANRHEIAGATLVDLRRIQGLAEVEQLSDGSLRLGAAATIASLVENRLVREYIPVLAEAALTIGDAQVRNRATIGGNIAASEAGADLPPLLLALNARIEIAGPKTSRAVSADEFFDHRSADALGQGELILAVTVPSAPKASGIAYEKMKHPATLFALCGGAAAVQLTPDGTISEVRIAVTGASERPRRLHLVEQALRGAPAAETNVSIAALTGDSELHFAGDLFASADYRRHLTLVLTNRALKRAIANATA